MTSKTVLKIWVYDLTFPGAMDQWMSIAREFEERHPEYQVDIRGINFFTGAREIAEAVAEGNGPVLAEYYLYLSQLARDTRAPDGKPRYTSIEKAAAARAEVLGEPVVIDDIIPPVRECYTYGGDLTSMPSLSTALVLYANMDMLQAAGVREIPRTWDEVEAACRAVTALPDGPSHGITWSNHGWLSMQAVSSQGHTITDNDNGRAGRATTVNLASGEMLAWVDWWRRLHENGLYLYTGKIPDWEGTSRLFAEQRVALRLSSSADANYMAQAARNAGFAFGVGAYPYNSAVPFGANTIAGTSLWLADRLDDATRDGALAFSQFAHNPHNAADRHKNISCLPVTQGAYDLLESEGWFDEHPYHRIATECLRTNPDRPRGPEDPWPPCLGVVFGDYAGIQDILTRAIQDVLVRGADSVTRLTQATEEAQGLLDAYNTEAVETGPHSPNSLRFEFFTDGEPYSGADMEKVVQLDR